MLWVDLLTAPDGIVEKHFLNPQGLNEILSEIKGRPVRGDWDKDLPSQIDLKEWKKEDAWRIKGKTAQQWGKMLHECVYSYIKKKLKGSGWTLFRGEIRGEEYDCLGWKGEPGDNQTPDLHIEMHFPLPKEEEKYEFEHITKQTDKMADKLRKMNAKSKYILIGAPPNRKITSVETLHPDIKVVYQEYKFKKTRIVKRKK